MTTIDESIELLTASLQELAAHTYNQAHAGEPATAAHMSVEDLHVPEEVEAFVAMTRAYADRTSRVSVGNY